MIATNKRGAKNSPDIDWPAYFFDEASQFPQRLMRSARKLFGDSADAEAAYNYALEEISAEGWKRLSNGYSGIGRADGFLAITFTNLLREYFIKKYGKKRPPKWVKDLGGIWPKIYQMLCLRRMLPETIVDVLCVKADQAADEVRRAIHEVRARIPNCGQIIGESYVDTEIEPSRDDGGRAGALEAKITRDEMQVLVDILGTVFPKADATASARVGSLSRELSASTASVLLRLRDTIQLEDSDRLILKLIYVEGQSVAKAARTLRMNEQKVRRRHKRLLDLFRAQLSAHGLHEASGS